MKSNKDRLSIKNDKLKKIFPKCKYCVDSFNSKIYLNCQKKGKWTIGNGLQLIHKCISKKCSNIFIATYKSTPENKNKFELIRVRKIDPEKENLNEIIKNYPEDFCSVSNHDFSRKNIGLKKVFGESKFNLKDYWMRQFNEPISSITHSLGLLLAVAAATLLIFFAYLYGTKMHLIGYFIFGISLIGLYAISAIYHFFPKHTEIKKIFQRLDHSMIFIFIASCYTPIALIIDNRFWGWIVLVGAWLFALVGLLLKIFQIKMSELTSTLIYVAMGSMLLFIIKPLSNWLSSPAMGWLFGGGIFYLIGAIFFLLEDRTANKNKFGMHEIFHIFVMLGSFSHVWLFLRYILFL